MGVRKQNVFLVSGRIRDLDGDPRGAVTNLVVCSKDETAVRRLIGQHMPDFSILSVGALTVLEDRVKKVKAVLAGHDQSWKVLVDPVLQMESE